MLVMRLCSGHCYHQFIIMKVEYLDYDKMGTTTNGAAVLYAQLKPFGVSPKNTKQQSLLDSLSQEDIANGPFHLSDWLSHSVFCPVVSSGKSFQDAAVFICQDFHVQSFVVCASPDKGSDKKDPETIPGYRLLSQRQLTGEDMGCIAQDIHPEWKVFELLEEYDDGYAPKRISVLLLHADGTMAYRAVYNDYLLIPEVLMLPVPVSESECPEYLNANSVFCRTVTNSIHSLVAMETYGGPNYRTYPRICFVRQPNEPVITEDLSARFGWPEFCVRKHVANLSTCEVEVFARQHDYNPTRAGQHIFDGKRVRSIVHNAFENDNTLKEFRVPEGVVRIGKEAFYLCERLDTITLPEGLKHIGQSSFFKCLKLKEVVIPRSVQRIEEDAFGMCQSLRRVVLPKSAEVDENAFRDCNSDCEFVYYS